MATHFQHSCLENPMVGGAWWATAHGVTQSLTPLTRLSSSSIHEKWSVKTTLTVCRGPRLIVWRSEEQTLRFPAAEMLCQDHSIPSCLRLSLSACLKDSGLASPTIP